MVGIEPPPRALGRGATASPRRPGLVHFPTSDTILLDQVAMRRKRVRQATITGARLLQQQLTDGGRRAYPVIVTLTYAAIDGWNSRHVSDYLKTCREWFRRRKRPFHYCWVAELQQRGAVHYHVMIWMPKDLTLPKPDKRGWWPHGFTRIEKARNAVGYLAKYVSKESLNQKFPKGLRLYGRGGLSIQSRIEMRWWCSPIWVRQWCKKITDVRRTIGGGWVCVATGEWRPSPFNVVLVDGQVFLIRKQHE